MEKLPTHFQTHWEKQDLGKGRFLPKVVDSIREIWSYAQCQSFSVYFIFGYAYLLRLDDVCGDQFGFDNLNVEYIRAVRMLMQKSII